RNDAIIRLGVFDIAARPQLGERGVHVEVVAEIQDEDAVKAALANDLAHARAAGSGDHRLDAALGYGPRRSNLHLRNGGLAFERVAILQLRRVGHKLDDDLARGVAVRVALRTGRGDPMAWRDGSEAEQEYERDNRYFTHTSQCTTLKWKCQSLLIPDCLTFFNSLGLARRQKSCSFTVSLARMQKSPEG